MLAFFLAMAMLTAPLSAAAADKVGYVDMPRAMNDVNDGKAAKEKLQKEFVARQKELDRLQKELKQRQEEFERRSGMMKPDVRKAKEDALRAKFAELQQTYMKLQRELVGQESQLTQEIGGKLRRIVEKIGDRDGYTMILDLSAGVLFHKRHLDITDEVVRIYNKQHAKK